VKRRKTVAGDGKDRSCGAQATGRYMLKSLPTPLACKVISTIALVQNGGGETLSLQTEKVGRRKSNIGIGIVVTRVEPRELGAGKQRQR